MTQDGFQSAQTLEAIAEVLIQEQNTPNSHSLTEVNTHTNSFRQFGFESGLQLSSCGCPNDRCETTTDVFANHCGCSPAKEEEPSNPTNDIEEPSIQLQTDHSVLKSEMETPASKQDSDAYDQVSDQVSKDSC